jgi:hypothetical protein
MFRDRTVSTARGGWGTAKGGACLNVVPGGFQGFRGGNRRRTALSGAPGLHVGLGRILASEIEAPHRLANLA